MNRAVGGGASCRGGRDAGGARVLLAFAVACGLGVTLEGRAVAQEAERSRAVEVRLVSAGGQPISGGTIRVISAGGEGPDDPLVRRSYSVADGAESTVVDLAPGVAQVLEATARGHRPYRLTLVPGPVPSSLRLVLAVDPYVLPSLRAEGRLDGSAPGSGSVRQVVFDHGSLTHATLAEWLSDVTGVSLRRRGAGGRQMLSVRGSRPEDVLVLLDGVSLNDPLTGRADLSAIPVSTLESATLVRGASSVRLGSGASAGALLLTSRGVAGSEAGAGLRYESPGGVGVDAHAGLGTGERRLGVSVAASRMTNEFDYQNRLLTGTPVETRRNADASVFSGALTGALGAVHGAMRVERSERGLPGRMGSSLFDHARGEDRAWSASLAVDGSAASISGSLGGRALDYRDASTASESSQGVGEARLAGRLRPLGRVPLTLGGRFTRESVSGDGVDGRSARTVVGAWVSASLGDGFFRVQPALAVDAAGSGSVLSPEIEVTWSASPQARAWARVGQGFRLPTFGDLYFATQRRIRANADLVAERVAVDSEIGGAGWRTVGGARVEGSVSLWYRRVDSPIVWLASSAAVWSPRNLGSLVSRGLELELSVVTERADALGWRVEAAAALDDSRVAFGTNRNALPYAPRGMGRLTLEGWWRAVSARLDVRHTGSRTTSVAATRRLPAFTTVDLTVSRTLDGRPLGFTVLGRVENMLDHRYELTELFPEPGRRFVVRLEARRSGNGS